MKIEFTELEKILKNPSLYYAHIKQGKSPEALETHTRLCQKYFQYIVQSKQVEDNIDLFIQKYMGTCSDEIKNLMKDMWCNVITYHDVGKMNPNFQKDKLERSDVEKDEDYSRIIGGKHSILSALIYLNDYSMKVRNLSNIGDEQKKRLFYLVFCNAYTISRHHSGLKSFDDFLKDLMDGTEKKLLGVLQKKAAKVCTNPFQLSEKIVENLIKRYIVNQDWTKKQTIWLYFYEKLTYSMLVAADYYATAEYSCGIQMDSMGELDNISEIYQIYQDTKVNQTIRQYEKEKYPMNLEELKRTTDINVLRNEIFLDAERQLQKEKNIFYLEAPTGSGKSNISMNLSFQLVMQDAKLKKIYYIYPFNTLIEQNQASFNKVFQNNPEIMKQITVVNSITPIKCVRDGRKKDEQNEEERYYEQALLNRQFLNYPIVLTTHVSLFDTIFGDSKESAFGFYQLAGSILVLDEIQSYKNSIWGEIITFLSELAEFMHMKIIIMSATLPNLEILKEKSENTVYLMKNREKYFEHPCFRQRVIMNKDLLNGKISIEDLYQHVKKNCGKGKKILIEFITKSNAEEFYQILKEDYEIEESVFCMTGDDSILERKNLITKVSEMGKAVILVATQVIEAGVDIDMDIGYKNISKMDGEEQFMGRINRSYMPGRTGVTYFFEMDEPQKIYKNDLRSSWEFSIKQPGIWNIVEEKKFPRYYDLILKEWENNNQYQMDKVFFKEQVGKLNFPEICKHMRLIDEQDWNMSVYLNRQIRDEKGKVILDGKEIWEKYKELLYDNEISYAKKQVYLSEIKVRMNYFIYEIHPNPQLIYNDQIGELFYIEDGDKYFENGRLNRKKIQGQLGEFVDFI